MPLGPLHSLRLSSPSHDDHASTGDPSVVTTGQAAANSNHDRSITRRRFLAGTAATASVGLAGCSGRLPNTATSVDATTQRDEGTLVWKYPASAIEDDEGSDGIGYAAVRLDPFDRARNTDQVLAGLRFRLNSTVGALYAGEGFDEYQADWFRFHIGVPRTYDGTPGFRAFVQPNQWPDLRVGYGYEDGVRELVVMAPSVRTDGTIVVEGQFRSADATLPRQLFCGFDVQASQPGPLGRTVTADGRAPFDVSSLALPDGVTLS